MKWGTGISVSLSEFVFVFVGTGVNGLMCLRTLTLGGTSRSHGRTPYLEPTAAPLSRPGVPEYVMTSWREKGQRWMEMERKSEEEGLLCVFSGLVCWS